MNGRLKEQTKATVTSQRNKQGDKTHMEEV